METATGIYFFQIPELKSSKSGQNIFFIMFDTDLFWSYDYYVRLMWNLKIQLETTVMRSAPDLLLILDIMT